MKNQSLFFVVSNREIIEMVATWPVSADNKFLCLIGFVFNPVSASLSAFVATVPPLCNNALKSLLLDRGNQIFSGSFESSRKPDWVGRRIRQHRVEQPATLLQR